MTQAHGAFSSEETNKIFTEINKSINSYSFKINEGQNETQVYYLALKNLLRKLEELDRFAKRFGLEINEKIRVNKVLTGEQVYILSNLVNIYHQISVKFNEINSYSKLPLDEKYLSSRDPERIQKDLFWLISYMALLESYQQNYVYYYKNAKLRRMLRNILKTSENKNEKAYELITMISHIMEQDNIDSIREHLKEFNRFNRSIHLQPKEIRSLAKEVRGNSSYPFLMSKKKMKIKNTIFVDNLMSFLGKVTNAVSGIFGNAVGKVRWRDGHLYNDQGTIERLNKVLQPLDILLEKTPFALTDTFIPGHFGHAAIYLGTETQLKEAGLWDSEIIEPYQEQISNGYVIIEAVRPGVRLTTLEHFMQVDDILVMRSNIDPRDKEKSLTVFKRSFDQIGKEYDFNFDVETTDKIVCSELIFFAFGQINWPTEYLLGRPTISPDNVAELIYYDNSPTSFTINIWSPKKGKIVKVTKQELGEKIGYVVNKVRSNKELQSYDKKSIVCKKVIKRNLRSGSRRSRRIEVRVCRDKFERRVYLDSLEIREKLYGNKQEVPNN
jgi:hypothetical protein